MYAGKVIGHVHNWQRILISVVTRRGHMRAVPVAYGWQVHRGLQATHDPGGCFIKKRDGQWWLCMEDEADLPLTILVYRPKEGHYTQ